MRMDQSETTRAASKKGKGGGGAVGKLLRSPFKRGETATRVSACGGGCGDSGSGSGRVGSAARPMDRDAVEVDGPGNAKIEQDYELYPWEKKMRDLLPLPSSSVFLSLLLLPRISDHSSSHYNTLEDTLARANAWLNSAQASGIPIVFMNVQTEALLTKISGDTASSTVNMGSLADLAKLSNVSLYGFEDYHGVDIGVVRAVRIWYAPIAGEMTLEIKLLDSDTRLGFAISRTDESKKRGLSLEEKREQMLQIFYDTQDFFLLKELEKLGPKKGVISQSVKDVVQSLVDDDLVLKDKIGTSVYFWSLPSCAGNQLRNTCNKFKDDLSSSKKRFMELVEQRDKLKKGREESDEREAALEELKTVELEHKKLKEELASYADNDPAALEAMKNATEIAHSAANRWTDNIFTLQQWCSTNFPEAKEQLEHMYKEVGITEDFEYLQ
ncbi:uncharacterized protein [Typha latifolia]|uniref:uncharacterized protein isoform X2 n=1 Tax=Typha latifolia TaxID=4733 RepID=UPI003C30098C